MEGTTRRFEAPGEGMGTGGQLAAKGSHRAGTGGHGAGTGKGGHARHHR